MLNRAPNADPAKNGAASNNRYAARGALGAPLPHDSRAGGRISRWTPTEQHEIAAKPSTSNEPTSAPIRSAMSATQHSAVSQSFLKWQPRSSSSLREDSSLHYQACTPRTEEPVDPG